eukprot:30918-Pelagococcus_subviridis.AAC.37
MLSSIPAFPIGGASGWYTRCDPRLACFNASPERICCLRCGLDGSSQSAGGGGGGISARGGRSCVALRSTGASWTGASVCLSFEAALMPKSPTVDFVTFFASGSNTRSKLLARLTIAGCASSFAVSGRCLWSMVRHIRSMSESCVLNFP